MYKSLKYRLENELKEIQKSGRFKKEREILTKQNSLIKTTKSEVINFCANNYLGLASNEKIIHEKYLRLVENQLHEDPHPYLWTHNRFKHAGKAPKD